MSVVPPSAAPTPGAPPEARRRRLGGGGGRRRSGSNNSRNLAGWLFVAPVVTVLGLFLFIPILMALWVSVSDWSGKGTPFASGFVGLDNYKSLVAEDGLTRQDFMTSLRNNFYYVVLVVPLQTLFALVLAVLLNQKVLKAKGFFRTAFYFPSVTSSVAISVVFLFLFSGRGAINSLLGLVGIDGPTWFNDGRGLIHILGDKLGLWSIEAPPAALTGNGLLNLTWWEWISGPSVALTVIIGLVVWTTTGTFMLMFLAALQDVPEAVEEAALVDGANKWQSFRNVTLPHLRPTLLLVITLGIIGTWQVFDQVFVMTPTGGPDKTTLTPAYLSYFSAFRSQQWGVAAATAFLLFLIIFTLTSLQRFFLRDKDAIAEKRAARQMRRRRRTAAREAGA